MESFNANNQQLFFYEKTVAVLSAHTERGILESINKLAKNKGFGLSDFEIVGAICFLVGHDYISQVEETPMVISNVNQRLENAGLTNKIMRELDKALRLVKPENIEGPKDELKSRITSKVSAVVGAVKPILNKMLEANTCSTTIVKDLDEFISKKELTYHDLLKFNGYIYESVSINGNCLSDMINLHNSDDFRKEIKKAADYFDDQKFAVLYFDSILTLREFIEGRNMSLGTLLDAKHLDNLAKSLSDKPGEQKPFGQTAEGEQYHEETQNMVIENDTDGLVKSVLLEMVTQDNRPDFTISSPEDLAECVMKTAEDADIYSRLYHFMAKNMGVSRTPFTEKYGFELSKFNEIMSEKSAKLKLEYKELMEEYAAEIPVDYLQYIVPKIQSIIYNLIVPNDITIKGHIIQQFAENQVHTYKQLHQTLELLEKCDIKVSKRRDYIDLMGVLEKDMNVSEVFKKVLELEPLTNKIKFLDKTVEFFGVSEKQQ